MASLIEYNLQRKRKRPSYFLLAFKTNTIVKLGNTEIGTSVIMYV